MIVRVLPRQPARASLVTAGLIGAMSTLAAIQPLLAGGGHAGMLMIDALCIVATTIGYLSMVDARRRYAASERARRDGLTGLYTKSAFFEMADQIDRHTEPVAYAMVMIDLDHFKSINDSFGHAAGDTVLEQTAQLIARSVRLTDIAARYGGEEFCILLRDCGAEEAARFAERPVAEASQLTVRLRDNRMASFTMSVGYACRGGSTGDGVRATFERADQALYLAKRAGRNRALQAIFTDSPLVEQVC
ncbi:hypothetical protein GCM10022212_26550 [Actimicrobium antarcticum]|uniref:diguanylate cyclase n=2 Tax=Actimicrobium antarcticum TaxID=1051899 RepID=A0ABP7TJM4_9BURK